MALGAVGFKMHYGCGWLSIEDVRSVLEEMGQDISKSSVFKDLKIISDERQKKAEKAAARDIYSYHGIYSCGLCGSPFCHGGCFK